ncbi:MAG TPA: uracil-DNA glycosylase family protein [Candidatus Paceibacterota bacterium]|nr:uracil-DNA glycosylase family protein [Candidatus Pacearchaeota archaeon]HRZ51330.1 uracil-DNA glycosylase family protein [Candidatus Paceibacterota bacterium]HSA37052.1 uracil-DNA glycosylase family protein [Candidatus Paceibacterota bacterium]
MDAKLEALKELNQRLTPPRELGGVFLPVGVKEQFEIMFVAEMPSMNEPKNEEGKALNFNFGITAKDRLLINMMKKYGVAGSYVTDIVKERDIPRKPTKEEIRKWLPFLLEEVRIIQPRAIIVLGKRTYEASFRPYVEPAIPSEIKIDYVFHYSQQGAKTNLEVEQRFSEVVLKIKNSV